MSCPAVLLGLCLGRDPVGHSDPGMAEQPAGPAKCTAGRAAPGEEGWRRAQAPPLPGRRWQGLTQMRPPAAPRPGPVPKIAAKVAAVPSPVGPRDSASACASGG